MSLLVGPETMRLTCPVDRWVFFFFWRKEDRQMQVWELFIIAVGLSMDAFAVSVCKGLSVSRPRAVHSLCCGLYVGAFQVLMPALGWLLGVRFQAMITSLDHWIAFALLGAIGFNMVRESRQEGEHMDSSFSPGAMLPLALATSIDALAVGVTFAFLKVLILPAVVFIGLTTFVLSAAGVQVGAAFGSRFQSRAELAGGVILILMGAKILLEHLGILG